MTPHRDATIPTKTEQGKLIAAITINVSFRKDYT